MLVHLNKQRNVLDTSPEHMSYFVSAHYTVIKEIISTSRKLHTFYLSCKSNVLLWFLSWDLNTRYWDPQSSFEDMLLQVSRVYLIFTNSSLLSDSSTSGSTFKQNPWLFYKSEQKAHSDRSNTATSVNTPWTNSNKSPINVRQLLMI